MGDEYDRLQAEWREFRRGLPARQRGEEAAFDAIWEKARPIVEGRYARRIVFDDIVLGMLMAREMDLQELRAELAEVRALKAQLDALVGASGEGPAGGRSALASPAGALSDPKDDAGWDVLRPDRGPAWRRAGEKG